MKLNDTKAKNAKAKDKTYKLTDGGGMYLQVTTKGQKYWRLDYRYAGKRKTLALGVYPQTSLKEARSKREEAKALLIDGADPSIQKRRDKLNTQKANKNTFEQLALAWHKTKKERWSKHHAERILKSFEKRIFPYIGLVPIEQITAPEILKILRKMEAEGLGEAIRRVKGNIERVFTFAIAEGKATQNPVSGLEKALMPQPKVKHNSYLKESEMPEFLKSLESYQGHLQIKLAFKLLMLTFVRTKELRLAKWSQFDLRKKQWLIPAEIMKMGEDHIVPLSDQAIQTLNELHELNGNYEHVFAGIRTPRKPMSENTMIYALYRMGYKSRATVHGFRATASTILNEHGFNRDWIERQLAHGERDEVRAAYNHADYLKERTKMMQWYSDKIDNLQDSSNVIVANFG